jgi:hypothetical protein
VRGAKTIYDLAVKASSRRVPEIEEGNVGSLERNDMEISITLTKTLDTCNATQQLLYELSNLSFGAQFAELDKKCRAGDVSRADYIRETERIEYLGATKNVLTSFDACKNLWGCNDACRREWARPPKGKTYEEYFETLIKEKVHPQHGGSYGEEWDRDCKDAYVKKQKK